MLSFYKSEYKIIYILGLLAFFVSVLTVYLGIKNLITAKNFAVVPGKIIAIRVQKIENYRDSSDNAKRGAPFDTVDYFHPKVSFTSKAGQEIMLELKTTTLNAQEFLVGQVINIRYNIVNPKDADVDSVGSVWGTVIVLTFFAIMIDLAFLAFFSTRKAFDAQY